MYQLVMVLITISLLAGLLLAGRTYVDPQRIMGVEVSERLLADRNRMDLALRGYLVANGVSAPETGWENAIAPFLNVPVEAPPEGLSWTYRPAPEGGGVCLSALYGVSRPARTEAFSCELAGASACYAPEAVGMIGETGWTGCEGMLIVNTAMLRSAGSPVAGGDGSFALIGPDSQSYTFGSGVRTIFTGQVTDMSDLFSLTAFNGDLSHWATTGATSMARMFQDAPLFNADIGDWDTSHVTAMNGMFEGASFFNQNLSGWCVSLIGSVPASFDTGADAWSAARPLWGTCPVAGQVTISLSSGVLPDAEKGTPYAGFDFATLLSVAGADPSALTWSSADPPAGMSLSPEGVLSGTPSGVGAADFTVMAAHTGEGVSDSRIYTLIINDTDPLIVEP